MDALGSGTRLRFGPALEWLIAASFLLATIAVGALIVSELRSVPRPRAAAPARGPDAGPPAAVPAGAVWMRVLPFRDGKELRIGDTLSSVASRFGRAAESGRQTIERGAFGERLIRFYEYAGSRFVVVFEPAPAGGELHVAAIYLQ